MFFNCRRWEDMVYPDIASSSQEVINQQVGDQYDIFLGIMWSRFGTPTGNADSGTEEEYDRAISRHSSGEAIRVSFLFCTADIPQSNLDGVQYSKVQELKRKVQSQGCLTRDFVDDASLINAVNLILDGFANSWTAQAKSDYDLPSSLPQPLISESPQDRELTSPLLDEIDDDGILDVRDRFEAQTDKFVGLMNDWGNKFDKIAGSANLVAEQLAQATTFGQPTSQRVREILGPMTDEMEGFADWAERRIDALEAILENLSSDTLKLADLSRAIDDSDDDLNGDWLAICGLIDSVDENNTTLIGLVNTIEGNPRIDKRLNKANRRVVIVHRKMIEICRIFRDNMELLSSDLAERLN